LPATIERAGSDTLRAAGWPEYDNKLDAAEVDDAKSQQRR
jgi:hypothetical protein